MAVVVSVEAEVFRSNARRAERTGDVVGVATLSSAEGVTTLAIVLLLLLWGVVTVGDRLDD